MSDTNFDVIYSTTVKYVADCLRQLQVNSERIKNYKDDVGIDTAHLIEETRKQPSIYAFYRGLYNVCRGAIKRCDVALDILTGELYDEQRNHNPLKLSSQEIKYYITQDSKYRELLEMKTVIECEMMTLEGICESLAARGFSINNIVKLRTILAEQERFER